MFYRDFCNIHGDGVYNENLDSFENPDPETGWRNLNIPEVWDYFSFIASVIYYDKIGFRIIIDNRHTPKKNEINFALAEIERLKTVKDYNQIDKIKFYGVEFVINDLDQICPILGFN